MTINIVSFPDDILRTILSYVLNLDSKSYVSCLLSCKKIYTSANSDHLLAKKITLIQMRIFCTQNSTIKLERPDEYDSEVFTIEHYGDLITKVNHALAALALKEAKISIDVAKDTVYSFCADKNLREQTLQKMLPQQTPLNPHNRKQKIDKTSQNKEFAKKIAEQILTGEILPEEKEVNNKIRSPSSFRDNDQIFLEIVRNLGQTDLTKAEKLVNSIPPRTSEIEPQLQEAALIEVLKIKVKNDPKNAFHRSLDLHYLNGSIAFPDIFETILTYSYEIAEKLAFTLEISTEQRSIAFQKLIELLTKTDIHKAWEYALQIRDEFLQKESINAIINYAHKNDPQGYKQLAIKVKEQQGAIFDTALVSIVMIEAQQDIPIAKKTSETIKDPQKREEAIIAILKVLALNPESNDEINGIIPHLKLTPPETLISELLDINIDLALNIALKIQSTTEKKDDRLYSCAIELAPKNLTKAFKLALHISDKLKREDLLLYILEYNANIQDLSVMKAIAKELLSGKPHLEHFDALKLICERINKELKEYKV